MKNSLCIVTFFYFFSFFSCSLNYMKSENTESTIPEFSFKNAKYTKYEAGKKNVELSAEWLEQYKSDNAVFAQNAEFETFSKNGEEETKGTTRLVAADHNADVDTRYGERNSNFKNQDMHISAESLRFVKKTEQITSGVGSKVNLQKKGMSLSGYGFSASGVSNSFSFSSNVEGLIQTEQDEK